MDLLFVALDDHKPDPGGVAQLTHAIVGALHDQGHRVEVLARDVDGAEAFDRDCRYPVARFDLPPVSVREFQGALRAFREIRAAIDRLNPDAVICNVLGHRGYLSALAASVSGVPFILFAHGNELTQPDRRPKAIKDRGFWALARLKRELTLRIADRIVCNSGFTESVVRSLDVPRDRTVVIHPGCDPSPDSSTPVDLSTLLPAETAGRTLLLTVGRLVPRKGIDRTLEGLEHVVDELPDLLYVIAGDGGDRRRLEEMVGASGLQDLVVFTGYVSEAEKEALYDAADIFIMASREREPGPRTGLPRSYEGFGIVFLEAALHELPSIAGREGGAVDAVKHGETGLLVDPRDPEAIADAIRELVRNPEKASRLGQAGYKRAVQRFTWEQAASDLIAVLEEISE